MNCPHCTADLPDDDIFCEECGERLSAEVLSAEVLSVKALSVEAEPARLAPLCRCGAPEGDLDEDGYCIECGRRCRALPFEHEEKGLSVDFAAVSDRGLRHHHNEDRFQIAHGEGRYVIVVCDGVSNSYNADTAANLASTAIADALMAGNDPESAIQAARNSVAELAQTTPKESAPSTTVVAAVIEQNSARIAWMGDSRAYWIARAASEQLTADHSWMNAVVSAGEMSYAEAAKSPQAHGITRWIGADGDAEMLPDQRTFQIPGAGWLLLCTDGLWNYAPEMDQLAGLVQGCPEGASALDVARRLVDYAIERGGSDNVTASLLRIT